MTSPSSLPQKNGSSLLRLGRLFLACVFLFTPNVSLFDLLPDLIGYALLLSAIREASYVFPHFDEARRGFKWMLYFSIAKIPASLLMLSIAGKNLDERSIVAVFSLAFAVLELIFMLPAARALLEGFVYIGEREGASVCLTDGRGNRIDSLTLYTTVFFAVKHGMSTLPELVLISLFEKTGALGPGAFNIAALYPFFAVLGAIIVLVMGILWLSRMRHFTSALRADEALGALLAAKAEENGEAISARADRRRSLSLLYLLMGASLFVIDPILDDRDVLPGVFAAVLFFLFFRLTESKRLALAGRWVSGIYGVLTLSTFIARELFFYDFKITDVVFRDEALFRYIPVEILTVAESAALIAVLLLVCLALRDFVLAKTGKGLRETDLVLRNDVHHSLIKKIKGLGVFGILYAVFRAAEVFLLVAVDRHVITEDEANQHYGVGDVVYSPRYGGSWFILLVLGIALAAYVFFLVRSLREEMGNEKEE